MAHILIIEDEKPLCEGLLEIMKEGKHDAVGANDGEAGLAAMRAAKPDLVLLDIILPKKDGITVLQEMRNDPALKDIPVIVLTNLSDEKTMETARQFTVQDFLVKTNYTLDEVLQKIQTVLTATHHA